MYASKSCVVLTLLKDKIGNRPPGSQHNTDRPWPKCLIDIDKRLSRTRITFKLMRAVDRFWR